MTTLPEIEDKIKHINRVHQEPLDLLSRPMNLEQIIEATEPPKILRLTLKKYWFDLMKTGIKNLEFRRSSNWIAQRLHSWGYNDCGNLVQIKKHYDYVEFSNGYSTTSPKFTVEYQGYFQSESDHFVKFNDSERIEVKTGDYVIKLGRVVKISE